ncbi:MAG: hypothetical protein DRQ56_05570 [Gammaproteobacteria bacterium]|nr:MAG: hypothetical protein DRQ56_05570 [Gammaproteobacteria bacterium]
MNPSKDLPLPFPPDRQQVELMRAVAGTGVAVASPGTDLYATLAVLCEGGFMSKVFCPAALGVYQFHVTVAGLEVLQ